MTETNPPSFSGASAVPTPAEKTNPEPPVRLPRLLLGLALAVAIFDVCFWNIEFLGFSVVVFVIALAGIILHNRESRDGKGKARLILALLVGAVVAAAIETSITNTLALLILIIALAGETFFSDIEPSWSRWLSQGIALIFALGRIFWLGARLTEATFRGGVSWTRGLIGGCLLAVPALVLALIFGSLLAAGNAVFGSWTNDFFDWLWKELALYLNLGRIALWLFVGFLILPLLRPANISAKWWTSAHQIPRFPEVIPTRAAIFSSGLVLVVLNLLFLIANIADELFLWSGQALPAGVTYKAYVHEGVIALIVTVILSAIVLTTIFQQALEVAKRRELKILAYVWIVQNLFLISSIAEKLRRYTVTFEMTVARLSTFIFLVLVLIGFILLSIKIVQNRSIPWLIGRCLLAVFVIFYITQFLDLAGWSANYNIAKWEKDRSRQLDFWHLYQYGPDAWPALRRAHEVDPSISIFNAYSSNGFPTTTDTVHQAQFGTQHWREFSLRAWLNRWALEEKQNN